MHLYFFKERTGKQDEHLLQSLRQAQTRRNDTYASSVVDQKLCFTTSIH